MLTVNARALPSHGRNNERHVTLMLDSPFVPASRSQMFFDLEVAFFHQYVPGLSHGTPGRDMHAGLLLMRLGNDLQRSHHLDNRGS